MLGETGQPAIMLARINVNLEIRFYREFRGHS